jgi:hypothetical protein
VTLIKVSSRCHLPVTSRFRRLNHPRSSGE